jgi:hypothetical protein
MLSANTVAQKPLGSVKPPLSAAHAVDANACVLLALAAVVSDLVPSVFVHAPIVSTIAISETDLLLLIRRCINGFSERVAR